MRLATPQAEPCSIEFIGTSNLHALKMKNDVQELNWLTGLQELSIEVLYYHAFHRQYLIKDADWTSVADALAGLKSINARTVHLGFRQSGFGDDVATTRARNAELAKQLRAKLMGSKKALA